MKREQRLKIAEGYMIAEAQIAAQAAVIAALVTQIERIEDLPVADNGERIIPPGFLNKARKAVELAEKL